MDNRFGITLAMLLACVTSGAISSEPENYLTNASFEIGNPATGLPKSWNFIQRGSMEKHCEMVDGDAFDGQKSVRIFNRDQETAHATLILSQSGVGRRVQFFTVNDPLEFSVMAKAEQKPVKLMLFFEAFGQKTQYKMFIVRPGTWQKLPLYFCIDGSKYVAGYVGLKLASQGSVLLDAPRLRKNKIGRDNLIANPSFEVLDEKMTPMNWIVKNRNANGSISVDKTMAAEGACSVRFSSPAPMKGGMLIGTKLDPALFNQIKPGTMMKLALKANTNGDPGVKFRYYIERMNGNRRLKGAMSPVETSYFGWMDKSFTFEYPADGPITDGRLWVLLMTPGNFNVDAVSLSVATEKDLKAAENIKVEETAYVRAVGLPARHTYFVPGMPCTLNIEYKLPTPDLKVELKLCGSDKSIQSWTVKNAKSNTVRRESIKLPALTENAYKLEYSWAGGHDQDFFRIRGKQMRGVSFNKENILLLNGKGVFPVGVYPAVETREMFDVYHKSGINTVVLHGIPNTAQAKRYAAILNPMDMAVLFCTTFCIHKKNTREAAREEVSALLDNTHYFSKIIGVTADELCWSNIQPEKVRSYYETFFRMAPDYVAWQNHAPRLTGSSPRDSFSSVRRFTRLSDVTGVDIYPVPDGNAGHNNLPDKSLACVGRYAKLAAQSGWNELPVWMILQAFSWDEYNDRKVTTQPLPTYRDLRFMVWNAILHGSRGIFYYQPGRLSSVWYGQFGRDMSNVNRELNAVSPVIADGRSRLLDGAPSGVRFIAFDDSRNKLFVAVNEQKNKAAKCSLPLDGEFYELSTGNLFKGKDFELPPYGVLILCTKPIRVEPEQGFHYTGPTSQELTIDGEWVVHPAFVQTLGKKVFFKQTFRLAELPGGKSIFRFCCDDEAGFYVNGIRLECKPGGFRSLTAVDIGRLLKKGVNEISGELINHTGAAGVVYELNVGNTHIASGGDTFFSENGKTEWRKAHPLGKPLVKPWCLPHKIVSY